MIEIKTCVTFGRVEDETLIVNTETGKVLKLDRQGTAIWELYYNGYSVEQIISHFSNQYPSQKSLIHSDVINFFEMLQTEKII